MASVSTFPPVAVSRLEVYGPRVSILSGLVSHGLVNRCLGLAQVLITIFLAANAMSGTLAQTSFIAAFLSTPDATARTDGLLAG